MTTIQIRIDEATKRSVKKILTQLGLDFSTAVKVYFKQIMIQEGIPFRFVTENGLTPSQEQEVASRIENIRKGKNVSKYMSTDELIRHLHSPKD